MIIFPQIDGSTNLTFATAYGFRNIQNILQKLKNGRCKYQFVEIMACPSGMQLSFVYIHTSIVFTHVDPIRQSMNHIVPC